MFFEFYAYFLIFTFYLIGHTFYEVIRLFRRRRYVFGKTGVAKIHYILSIRICTGYRKYSDLRFPPEFGLNHERKPHVFTVKFKKGLRFKYSYNYHAEERVPKIDMFNHNAAHQLYRHLSQYHLGRITDYSEAEICNFHLLASGKLAELTNHDSVREP